MVIDMEKLARQHYLKHYLGCPAMFLSENQSLIGQIEQVDMEDASVLIKCQDKSYWVDGEHVTPITKSMDKLTEEDLRMIIDNLVIGYEDDSFPDKRLSADEIKSIDTFKKGFRVNLKEGNIISFYFPNWRIESNWGSVQNIGTIMFLLCELGFDVTGYFKK